MCLKLLKVYEGTNKLPVALGDNALAVLEGVPASAAVSDALAVAALHVRDTGEGGAVDARLLSRAPTTSLEVGCSVEALPALSDRANNLVGTALREEGTLRVRDGNTGGASLESGVNARAIAALGKARVARPRARRVAACRHKVRVGRVDAVAWGHLELDEGRDLVDNGLDNHLEVRVGVVDTAVETDGPRAVDPGCDGLVVDGVGDLVLHVLEELAVLDAPSDTVDGAGIENSLGC